VPLRILFAAHPDLLAPVVRIAHRVIAAFLLGQARPNGAQWARRRHAAPALGSAANLNLHLHCRVLDRLYRRTQGEPAFRQRVPTFITGLFARSSTTTLYVLASKDLISADADIFDHLAHAGDL
jgi:hypothetical protein